MRNLCRPKGRFFCLLVTAACLTSAARAQASGPAMTQVTDTVYRADGTVAQGIVLLTWPAFTTVDGKAVAAGSLGVKLSSGGAFTASLAPNIGAQPAGVSYKVVYQLAGQEPSTEYWVVPATGSTTIGAVRAKLMPPTIAAQVLTRDVAESNYVHVNGAQTISGTVTFASSPTVPAPQNTGDAANKAYVDAASANLLASPAPIGSATPNSAVFTTLNNVLIASAAAGADACSKLRNAALAAVASGNWRVDATGFVGTNVCTSGVDPFANLWTPVTDRTKQLEVDFGCPYIRTSVPWTITNSNIILRARSNDCMILEYTGTSTAAAVLATTGIPSARLRNITIENIYFVGAHATDGVLLVSTDNPKITNIGGWGFGGCGLHTQDVITPTITNFHMNISDAAQRGFGTGSYQWPLHGICLDRNISNNWSTTDATVLNPIVEGLQDSGLYFPYANQVTVTGGASETNNCTLATQGNQPCTAVNASSAGGAYIGSGSSQVHFNGTWFEGNGQMDVYDNGLYDGGVNIIASSQLLASSDSIQLGTSARGPEWGYGGGLVLSRQASFNSRTYKTRAMYNTGSTTWVKLGTVRFNSSSALTTIGSSCHIKLLTGNGFGSGSHSEGVAEIVFRAGNSSSAPNVSQAAAWTMGDAGLTGLKLVGASSSSSETRFDVYLYLKPYAVGEYAVTLSADDTWTSTDALSTDPGSASSTVVVGTVLNYLDDQGNATVQNLTVNGACTGCGGSNVNPGAPGQPYYVSKYANIQAAIDTAYNNGTVQGPGTVIDDRTTPYTGPGFIVRDSVTLRLAATTYTITGKVTNNNGVATVTAGIISMPGSHIVGAGTSANHGTNVSAGTGLNADLIATSTVGTGAGANAQWWHWGSIENFHVDGNKANQTAGTCLNVENMGETAMLRSLELGNCYKDDIKLEGNFATQSEISNITVNSAGQFGVNLDNFQGVGVLRGLSGDSNATSIIRFHGSQSATLTVLGLKSEEEISGHDPLITIDMPTDGSQPGFYLVGGYTYARPGVQNVIKVINGKAGAAPFVTVNNFYVDANFVNAVNDTVNNRTFAAANMNKIPFSYLPTGSYQSGQAFTFAPGTFIQGGSSALTEIFGSSTDGSSMIAAQGNGDGTSYYTGGLKFGIPNRTQFGTSPEMMARMGSRFLGAGQGYDTSTWVFVPIWKTGDASNRWIGEPNQRWPEVYAADVNTTTATVGTLNVTNCVGCGSGSGSQVNSDWNASSGAAQILNKPTIPVAAATTPAMNGTGAAGSSANYARADHVHPTDTTRAASNASITVNGANCALGSSCSPLSPVPLYFTNGSTASGTSTTYVGLAKVGTTDNYVEYIVPRAGTIQGCYAYITPAQTGANTWTMTMNKNGGACTSPSAINILFNSSATAFNSGSSASDLTHGCSVNAGDMVDIKLTPSSGTTLSSVSVACMLN
jgi:hypothetical protein